MAGQFEGKVALVTGGGSGIGRASALAFAREGARVVVADVQREGGEETVRLIQTLSGGGNAAIFAPVDIAESSQVEAVIATAVATWGRLDFAHNNAGIEGSGAPAHLYPEDDWRRIIGVNLIGTWLCMKYEIDQMLQNGGGAIVNTASVAGLVASPASGSAYTASKHGILGLTKSAALEYAQSGIRINAVCPGVIQTPLVERHIARHPEIEQSLLAAQPGGRMGSADEVAAAVIWLCSDAASFVTGHPMVVDGGFIAK
jgi:NAD(P)-dependent dehydrogenase (short-subunit alcohol dehydrogenase family)